MNTDPIATAYSFTNEDKQQLANMLAQSYLLAKVQAYNRAISHTKHVVQIRQPWQPTETDAEKAQEWAESQVESIASTYIDLLSSTIEGALLDPQEKKDDKKDVLYYLFLVGSWFKKFIPWKTQQVANVTISTGENDGTQQFIEDVQDEEKADEVMSGGRSMLHVVVLPAHSSSDECSEIAGKTFALNAAPELPMHPNCIHYKTIIIVDE